MKKVTQITLLMLFSFSLFSQSTSNWIQTNTNNIQSSLIKILFVNDTLGFGITFKEIIKTTDEGNTWYKIHQLDSSHWFQNIYQINNQINFYSENNNRDSSQIITLQIDSVYLEFNTPSLVTTASIERNAISYKDSLWAIDALGLKVQSGNGYRYAIQGNLIGQLSVWNGKYLASSTSSHILLSNDSGLTWSQVPYPHNMGSNINQIYNFGGDTLIHQYGGFPHWEYSSYNKGINWFSRHNQTNSTPQRPFLIYPFTEKGYILGVGSNGILMTSRDLGITYNLDTISHNIVSAHLKDSTTFFALCANGVIYKSTNAGGLVGIQDQESLENRIDIYPNPASNVIHLNYENSVRLNQVELYNIEGKLIKKFNPRKRKLDVSEIAVGTYILKLERNTERFSKKIVIQ